MADTARPLRWIRQLVFVAVALGLILLQLVPQSMVPRAFELTLPSGVLLARLPLAGPDLLLAVTVLWVARRPDFVPVYVVALIFLLADLFFGRPPGLWAGLVVVLTETLRNRARSIRNMPFALEWGTVATGIVAITLLNRLVLFVFFAPMAPLGLTLVQMIATILCYPLVMLVAQVMFGISRPAPGQVDSRGQPL